MTIQTIIDKAQQIEIDRKRMVGQTISRSQRIKTSERNSAQPWKFKVTPPARLNWEQSRGIIEVISMNERVNEYEISLNNNPALNYITAYQGDLTQNQLNGLTVTNFTTATMTVGGLPSISSTKVIFAQGDIVQPVNSRYPYTVTETVYRGTGTTVTVTTNRPAITSESVNLLDNLKVGNSATWHVVVTGLPTYSLIPMKQVQFNGDFELIERIV